MALMEPLKKSSTPWCPACSTGLVTSRRGKLVMRVVAFLAAYMATMAAFAMFAFTVYLNALKVQFELTQSQVELLMSLEWLGIGATLPVGAFVLRFGLRMGALLGLILPTSAHLLIWSACLNQPYYSEHYFFLAIYFFLAGCGCGVAYLVAIAATVQNFSSTYRCTVIGILSSASSLGPIAAIFLYDTFFLVDVYDDLHQDVEGYFLVMSGCYAAVNLFCLLVYGEYLPDDEQPGTMDVESATASEDDETTPMLEQNANKHGTSVHGKRKVSSYEFESESPDSARLSLRELLRTPAFHFTIWPFVIILGMGPMDVNNLTTFLISYNLDGYSTSLPYLSSIIGFVGKVSLGGLSDLVVRRFPRIGFVLIACVTSVVTYILSIFWLDNIGILVTNLFVVNMAAVVIWSIGPSILIEEFGQVTFVRDWGIVQFGYGVSAFSLQYMFGGLYDAYVEEGTTCYGRMCFVWSFVIAAVLCVIGSVLSGVYLRQRWKTTHYERAPTSDTLSPELPRRSRPPLRGT